VKLNRKFKTNNTRIKWKELKME